MLNRNTNVSALHFQEKTKMQFFVVDLQEWEVYNAQQSQMDNSLQQILHLFQSMIKAEREKKLNIKTNCDFFTISQQ